MIVFEYFYEKMGTVFTQLINEGAKKDIYKLYPVDSNEVNHYCSYVFIMFVNYLLSSYLVLLYFNHGNSNNLPIKQSIIALVSHC